MKPSKTYHANVYWQRVSPLLLANYMFRPDFAVAKYFSTLHMANDSFTAKVDFFFVVKRTPQIMLYSAKACAPGIAVSEQIFSAKSSVCFSLEL